MGGSVGGKPCPASVTYDSGSPWVIFTIRKSCFPGKNRRVIGYTREANSYNDVMREDGVVDDTSEQASDWTNSHTNPLALEADAAVMPASPRPGSVMT